MMQQHGGPPHTWGGVTTADERMWGMLAHLSGFFSILGPLIIYLTQKDQSRFAAYHALQQLFFDLIVVPIIVAIAVATCGVGAVLVIGPFIFKILAAVKANNGEYYELPLVSGWARKSVYGF